MTAVAAQEALPIDGDVDRETTIRRLLPLVRRIAKRVAQLVPTCDLGDLIGDGCVGAIRAVDGFDPNAGATLQHYASRVILGAMLNGVRRMDPVSERVRRLVRIAERQRFERAIDDGHLPTAVEMEATIPGLARARAHAHNGSPLSLDAELPRDERSLSDRDADPQRVAEANAERDRIHHAVNALPTRLRSVVIEHYVNEHSLRTISRRLDISPQRASQLHLIALEKLRTTLVHA